MGPSGPQSIDLVLWVGLGAICLVMIGVALWHGARQRPARAGTLTREQWARIREEKELAMVLEDLLARVDEVSRRVGADLEARQSSLRALLDEADLRIARLQAVDPAHEPIAGRTNVDSGSLRPDESENMRPAGSVAAGADNPMPATMALPRASGPMASRAARPGSLNNRHRRIQELADTGADLVTIADALQMPVGEVELVLNLRRFTQSA